MKELLKLLQQTELFRELPAEVIRDDILPHGKLQELHKDYFIIEPQQCVDFFSIVVTGKIHILHLFPDGNYSLITALTAGEVLGIDLICTRNQTAPYYAAAVTTTTLLTFPGDLLLKPGILREEYGITVLRRLLTMISQHNMKKEYRLAILSQKGLRERIVTYLLMQSNKRHSSTFRIPFSREEMASFLCVNRSALSHELSQMEREGLISFRKNEFTLLHPEKWTVHYSCEL